MADMVVALRSGYTFDEAKRIWEVVSENARNWLVPISLMQAKETLYHTVATVEFQQMWNQMMKDIRRDTVRTQKKDTQSITRMYLEKMHQSVKEEHIQEYVVSTVCHAGDFILMVNFEDVNKDKAEFEKMLNGFGIEYTGLYSWFDDEIDDEAMDFLCSAINE